MTAPTWLIDSVSHSRPKAAGLWRIKLTPDLETEGWLESFRSAMLQVLSLSNLHLVTSWLTTKMGLKALVATKAPSTALLARLNDAWKGRALRRKLVGELRHLNHSSMADARCARSDAW